MAVYGELLERIGDSTRKVKAHGAHIFKRAYYEMVGSGDMRGEYVDAIFSSAAGAGEAVRLRGIANALLTATGGTVNALHATGRVAASKTVSGALNAIRATLEVAAAGTPGGTLAAIQADVNAPSSTVFGPNDAYVRVSNSGTVPLTNLFNFDGAVGNHDATDAVVMESAAYAASDLVRAIKCRVNGATFYLVGTTTAPKA